MEGQWTKERAEKRVYRQRRERTHSWSTRFNVSPEYLQSAKCNEQDTSLIYKMKREGSSCGQTSEHARQIECGGSAFGRCHHLTFSETLHLPLPYLKPGTWALAPQVVDQPDERMSPSVVDQSSGSSWYRLTCTTNLPASVVPISAKPEATPNHGVCGAGTSSDFSWRKPR